MFSPPACPRGCWEFSAPLVWRDLGGHSTLPCPFRPVRGRGVQGPAAGAEAQARRDHEVPAEAQVVLEPENVQRRQPGVSRGPGSRGSPCPRPPVGLDAAFGPPLSCRKVVRRASLSDRTNLYRKEYEGEAILWQQRSAAEDQRTAAYNGDVRETRTDQENKDPVSGPMPCPGVSRRLGRRPGPQPGLASSSERLQGSLAGQGPQTSWIQCDGGYCG